MAHFAPRPDPNPCHNNCGAVYVDGAEKEEITCPCGFGYYDRNGDFVPGSLVREGKKPTRAEYRAHVEACDRQERGRPILHERRSGGLVYQGARDTRGVDANARTSATPMQTISSSQPSRHYQTASDEGYMTVKDRDTDALSPSGPMRDQKPGTKQSRTTAKTVQDATVKEPGGKDYFLPSESIRQDVLQHQLKSLFGPTATAKPSTFRETSGYLIYSSRRPTQEDIAKLKSSSQIVEDAQRQRLGVSQHHLSGGIRDAIPPVNRLPPQDAYQSRRLSPDRVTNPYPERHSSAETCYNLVSISQQLPSGLEYSTQSSNANQSRATPSRYPTTVSERDRQSTAQTAGRRTSEQTYDREPAVSRVPQPRGSDRDLSRQQRQESDHHRRSRHDSVMEEETGHGMRQGSRAVRIQRTVDDLETESEEDNKRDRYG